MEISFKGKHHFSPHWKTSEMFSILSGRSVKPPTVIKPNMSPPGSLWWCVVIYEVTVTLISLFVHRVDTVPTTEENVPKCMEAVRDNWAGDETVTWSGMRSPSTIPQNLEASLSLRRLSFLWCLQEFDLWVTHYTARHEKSNTKPVCVPHSHFFFKHEGICEYVLSLW